MTPGTSDSCRPRGVVTRDFSTIFDRLFDRLPVRILTSDLHHWILWKKIFHIRAYDFGVQFSFNMGRSVYVNLEVGTLSALTKKQLTWAGVFMLIGSRDPFRSYQEAVDMGRSVYVNLEVGTLSALTKKQLTWAGLFMLIWKSGPFPLLPRSS